MSRRASIAAATASLGDVETVKCRSDLYNGLRTLAFWSSAASAFGFGSHVMLHNQCNPSCGLHCVTTLPAVYLNNANWQVVLAGSGLQRAPCGWIHHTDPRPAYLCFLLQQHMPGHHLFHIYFIYFSGGGERYSYIYIPAVYL